MEDRRKKPGEDRGKRKRPRRYRSAEFYDQGCDVTRKLVKGTQYYQCFGTWYKRRYSSGEVYYVECDPPPEK